MTSTPGEMTVRGYSSQVIILTGGHRVPEVLLGHGAFLGSCAVKGERETGAWRADGVGAIRDDRCILSRDCAQLARSG